MIVDDQVGIQGNGNQDGQSWYHSQEANIMIDSKEVCAEWMTGILCGWTFSLSLSSLSFFMPKKTF